MGILSIAVRLAAAGDTKEIVKKAVKRLSKDHPRLPDEDPRSYNDRLTEMVLSGYGGFERSILDEIEKFSSDLLPRNGKFYFISWLYEQMHGGWFFSDDDLRMVKDFYVGTGHLETTLKGKDWGDVHRDAEAWHDGQGLLEEHEFSDSSIRGYSLDPSKTLLGQYGSFEVHHIHMDSGTPDDIENDLLYEGNRMRICVGKVYSEDVVDGRMDIYSFRQNGTPRITVSVLNGPTQISEMKANSNQRVTEPEQVNALCEFLVENFEPNQYYRAEGNWFISHAPIDILEKVINTTSKDSPEKGTFARDMTKVNEDVSWAHEFRIKIRDNPDNVSDIVIDTVKNGGGIPKAIALNMCNYVEAPDLINILTRLDTWQDEVIEKLSNSEALGVVIENDQIVSGLSDHAIDLLLRKLDNKPKRLKILCSKLIDNMGPTRSPPNRISLRTMLLNADHETILRNFDKLVKYDIGLVLPSVSDENKSIMRELALHQLQYFKTAKRCMNPSRFVDYILMDLPSVDVSLNTPGIQEAVSTIVDSWYSGFDRDEILDELFGRGKLIKNRTRGYY